MLPLTAAAGVSILKLSAEGDTVVLLLIRVLLGTLAARRGDRQMLRTKQVNARH
jgi:hypothetical protein